MDKISTIKISQSTKKMLKNKALTKGESYENIILRLLHEDDKMVRVKVYDNTNTHMGFVEYNDDLDTKRGTDSFHMELGRHLGIEKFGERYVIIHGNDMHGHRDYADIVEDKTAYKLIKEYNDELLEEPKFKDLSKFDYLLEDEKLVKINNEIEKCRELIESADDLDESLKYKRSLHDLIEEKRRIWDKL